jgi:hypothetical protein
MLCCIEGKEILLSTYNLTKTLKKQVKDDSFLSVVISQETILFVFHQLAERLKYVVLIVRETQGIMEFELFPNEILIECFEFLNAFDIFNSFDQLNYRFDHLIRNIPLHLNFGNVDKTNIKPERFNNTDCGSSHPIPRCWTLRNRFRPRNQFHRFRNSVQLNSVQFRNRCY